ncbi:MAG: malto-oligosyltrehalose synthase [Fibrobacter sp.]|mgnify:CR=1 FL=1|nr:malto-oligosyltrehalose synthase [Fibrobacter sp.]
MDIPISTYRLQFNPSFTFKDASSIIPYLKELGISHIYASPIFKARKGSQHGYDIADPRLLNEKIGDRADFDRLTEQVAQAGLGWIQDIVPNHMAFDSGNHLLMDLFENGPDFLPLQYFDIDWNHTYESLRGRLLAPILGGVYGECLERGEIKLTYDQSGFAIRYYGHFFPLRIETYARILDLNIDKLKVGSGVSHPGFLKLLGVLYSIKNLPAAHQMESRKTQVNFTKAILWELYTTDSVIREFIDDAIKEINGVPGKPETFSLLDALHSEQVFKLSFWKVATEELNYRRFFTVNDLISIRVEDEQVFRDTHELIFELINAGKISGLRVDHIDGLYDPHLYLERLRKGAPESFIIVEKILGLNESLPGVWPIQGTTGYDFCNYVNNLFCYFKNRNAFEQLYTEFTGQRLDAKNLLIEKKRLIISKHMAGDIDNLAHLIKKVSGRDRRGTDITLYGLRSALVELLSSFPVYRSYINGKSFSNEDRNHLQTAISDALSMVPGLSREFAFIERFLLLQYDESASEEEKQEWTNVVMRFQQFTGPLMAKGFEDTVLYIYNRLCSLNEVGGWPWVFGIRTASFHSFCSSRLKSWPNTMNSTSTHDTKRGEDVRARINVLSEMPREWERFIRKCSRINLKLKIMHKESYIPDSNDEYLFYQTLIGAYNPGDDYQNFVNRIREYMQKVVREAKVHTGWVDPHVEYEKGLNEFICKALDRNISGEFIDEFIRFFQKISAFGIYNSISQCLLKITAPGLPDFYQGTELWDLNLVDPDNRREIDYRKRALILKELKQGGTDKNFINSLLEERNEGRVKMFLIYRCLEARKRYRELFQSGIYKPLKTGGTFKGSIVAFTRDGEENRAIIAVPRFLVSIISPQELPLGRRIWKDSYIEMPSGERTSYTDALTGRQLSSDEIMYAGDLFETFPGALLIGNC